MGNRGADDNLAMDVEGSSGNMLQPGTKLSDGHEAEARRGRTVMRALSQVNYCLGLLAFIGVVHLELSSSASSPAPAALLASSSAAAKGHNSDTASATTTAATTAVEEAGCPVSSEVCGAAITSD